MTSNSLKEKVNQCIDERREKIISRTINLCQSRNWVQGV